jgi:hypothetical protein
MQTIRTMTLHSMKAKRLAPGCCLESPSTLPLNQVICEAGGKSAKNAIHLGRPLKIFVELPGSLPATQGQRSLSSGSIPMKFFVCSAMPLLIGGR